MLCIALRVGSAGSELYTREHKQYFLVKIAAQGMGIHFRSEWI